MRYVFDFQSIKRKVIAYVIEKYNKTSKNNWEKETNNILLNQRHNQ